MDTGKLKDLAVLKAARPYVRSILAFLIGVRLGFASSQVGIYYHMADQFIAQLVEDVKSNRSQG